MIAGLAFASASVGWGRSRLNARPELPQAAGEREAKQLISETLAQRPEQAVTNTGAWQIRDAQGDVQTVPARFISFTTKEGWTAIYDAAPRAGTPAGAPNARRTGSRLRVLHTVGKPNRYLLSDLAADGTESTPKELTGGALYEPFAGSDFCPADLGLEFLSWPKQRVIRSEMRHSRSCKLLESVNPKPAGGAYSQVISWITVETPHAPVHADAYQGSRRIKEFDPKSIERVHGSFELHSVEMRNLKTGGSTIMEF
ncbi:MAG TPA: outer membrane lipoprotein-sorting protein [Verrucomicrobiae bacterium]|nr:outer membrane lipoprotein-sorting protein [Verrucomicrobiae bacterium]